MELVILSALAAVVILVAEIRELASRQRHAVPAAAGATQIVSVTDHADSGTTHESPSAELDRAA